MDQSDGARPGFRLSAQQQHLVLGSRVHVTQAAIRIAGPIDPEALRAALERAVARHEILRTTIAAPLGIRIPQQLVHEQLPPAWSTEHATGGSEPGQRLAEVLDREAAQPFELRHGPLLRAALVDGELLVLTAPAAIADGTSLAILWDELAGELATPPAVPEEDPIQFADYAEWRHELREGDEQPAVQGRGFWEGATASAPPAPNVLFADRARGEDRPLVRHRVELDAELAGAIRKAAESARVPEGVFLEACWHALIARLSGASELVGAGFADGRAEPSIAGAIGPYAQMIPVATRFEEGTSLAEIVDQVRRARATGIRSQDYATAEELTALGSAAGFGFGYADDRPLRAAGAAGAELLLIDSPLAGPWLQCGIRAHADVFAADLHYDPDAITREDVESIAARLPQLLASAAADPQLPVDRLAIIGPGERRQLLQLAAGPADPDSPAPVHLLFERQADLVPDRRAARAGQDAVTFAELEAAANRLAHHLRALGAERGGIVAICLERGIGMLTALLATLKAGAAYLPLNGEHPAERLAHQLTESGAAVLVTESSLLARMPEFAGATVCVDRDSGAIAARSGERLVDGGELDDLAYVIYTSGSTGLPKGVAVTHANLANYTSHVVGALGLDVADCPEGPQAAVISSLSTDLGNTAIFPTLATGGCLHLIDPDVAMDPDAFAAETAAEPIDLLKITPSHLRALVSDSGAGVLPARWLLVGGEALPWDLVARARSLRPDCRIFNHYGPTETTIGCCMLELSGQQPGESATVPIGRPISGDTAYVVDRGGEPVPVGVAGELWIGGAGVARGYVNRPEETSQRFEPDPFGAPAGARVYRTGDRVRRLRDGTIEFLGRVDQQVKIRGYRVEPAEVETVLAGHPAVRQAAVLAREDAGGIKLAAYVVPAGEAPAAELAGFLGRSLPEYMIPSTFAEVSALPLTPSGKVDRQALLALEDDRAQREDEFVAPRDAIEREIADIWADLLGIERVGVHDDFFALGGHSLLATQAIMRIRRAHGDIPLHALLGAPTVEALAEVVRRSEPDGVWQNVGTGQQ